jgi:hypothetical protein
MAYTVVRRFTKTNEQDWSGIYYNVSKSLDPTPDIRDQQFNSFSDIKDKSREFTQDTQTNFSYLGSKRVFESDNILEVKYYFETLEDAVSFTNTFKTGNTVIRALGAIVKEKQDQNVIPRYDSVIMKILDGNDNVIPPNQYP